MFVHFCPRWAEVKYNNGGTDVELSEVLGRGSFSVKLSLCGKRHASAAQAIAKAINTSEGDQADFPQVPKPVLTINEPFLTGDLEDVIDGGPKWTALALRELARQLTYANDYYYPLLSAAEMIERGLVGDPEPQMEAAE